MNIGLFINDVHSEEPEYATTCLARAAVNRGHEAWYIGVEDFAYDPDESVKARAHPVRKSKYKSNAALLEDLQRKDAPVERIAVADLDVLLLRNNPSEDVAERPWAQSAGVIFGQLAARQGVIVLNDPSRLANALNKLYFQVFPEEVRPSSLITRDRGEIKEFVESHKRGSVLKPLQGSGGQNVFLAAPDDLSNLNQIIDAILRDGYVVAQEYLPAAAEGDLRIILVNGKPLMYEGKYASFRRMNVGGDMRSNIHAGGEGRKGEVTDKVLAIAEVVRPKLIQDGMFLVGLDIAGDKLMEVNVFSPGGLYSMEKFEDAPFSDVVIEALEHKVDIRRRYGTDFTNIQIATM
jgi:glutathione synthase